MRYTTYRSLESLAIEFGLPAKYLRELSVTGQIPSLNVNGRQRYNPEQVQRALDELAAKRPRQERDYAK